MRSILHSLWFGAAWWGAFSTQAQAATIQVPLDQPTIAAGLAAAASGDTVLVACGTYLEHGLIMASGATLRSASGDPACVTIDGQSLGRILDCSNVADGTRIEGITFKSGSSILFGAGIVCVRANPTISDCVFESCVAQGAGGAIGLDEAAPTISRCTFRMNGSLNSAGGAIFAEDNSSLVLNDCVFEGNSDAFGGGAIYVENDSDLSAAGCRFISNDSPSGGAVCISNASPTFTSCIFSGNSASEGAAISHSGPGHVLTLESCTFSRNESLFAGAAIDVSFGDVSIHRSIIAGGINAAAIACNSPGSISISCSNLYGNANGDWVGCVKSFAGMNENFSLDPLFCDAAEDDLSIRSDSPCVNHGSCGLVGTLGVGCDPDAIEPESWGSIKARYR
jgi:predicted outer membrane repeat protein